MAAGSRSKFALDLNDIFAFPDGDNLPLRPPNTQEGESWVMLVEITGVLPTLQSPLTYIAKDITGKWFKVIIMTSNPRLDTVGYKPGRTLCILDAQPQFGVNEQFYIVDDISKVQLLPVSLKKLWELNDGLRKRSDNGDLFKCVTCGIVAQKNCAKCKSRYCSKDCQRADWSKHKGECEAIGVLHRYNRTDWG